MVVDSYCLEGNDPGNVYLAIAYVCKHGLKDCNSNEFYARTEPIEGPLDETRNVRWYNR